MTIGWNFPKNNFGQVVGIGEAGVETFKGSPFNSLAREICQNSLDARLDDTKPIIVEFKEFKIKTKDLNHYEQLIDVFERCKNYWSKQNSTKTINFFDEALKKISKDEISALRISDFNTTGLTGSDKEYNTPWQNLVKSSGVSDKGGSAGGSFGIGKSAPYACSCFRTIYYSTLDHIGLEASQGVSRLVTFEDKDGDTTQGTGYYGNIEKNSPIPKKKSLDKNFVRDESGTDIYILGFNNKEKWQDEMIMSILDDFLVSILENKLIVKVEETVISKDTIGFLINKHRDDLKMAYNYYQVLTAKETQIFEYNVEDLGKVELHVLLNHSFHRKVLISRSNGMKLFDKAHISSTIYFAGVLILRDEQVNGYFREMETPQHNAWEPERHSNPKEAKKKRGELYKYIKNQILEIGRNDTVDEIDAEGVGEYLPAEMHFDLSTGQLDKEETISDKTKNIEFIPIEQTIKPRGVENDQKSNAKKEVDILGIKDEDGDIDAWNPISGKNNSDGGLGHIDSYKEDEHGNRKIRKAVSIKTSKTRLFVIDDIKNRYKLIFTPDEFIEDGYIRLEISGEQSNITANIKNAYLHRDLKMPLKSKAGKVFLKNIDSKEKIVISFELAYDENCSMEVGVYGYSK